MIIFHKIENIEPINGSAVTVGTFDGFHLGHQAILSATRQAAEAHNLNSLYTSAVLVVLHHLAEHILNHHYPLKRSFHVLLQQLLSRTRREIIISTQRLQFSSL